jgi:lysophospholipase L1-like esterase
LIFEIEVRVFEYNYYNRRNREIALAAKKIDKNVFRIICIGESTVEGHNLLKEKVFPGVLQDIIVNSGKRNVQVYNLGISAITASKIASRIDDYLSAYKPDLVILLIGTNIDFTVMRLKSSSKIPWLYWHINNLKIFKFIDFLKGFFNRRYWGKQYKLSGINDAYDSDQNDKAVLYIIEESKKYSKNVIVCNYFISWFNYRLAELAKKENVIFCDNEKIYLAYKKMGEQGQLIASDDSWHPNEKGNKLIAQNIYECIMQNSLIESNK